jgi:histidine ammonia-lyase
MTAARIDIGEEPLVPETVVKWAGAATVPVELTPSARARIAETHRTAEEISARRPVYGRTTGVGANRLVEAAEDRRGHALRLLRSHATQLGAELPEEVVRATLLIRLSQLAASGGGLRPELADALATALRGGWLPRLREAGGIGTGDLTVLAQVGLALAGEDGGWRRAGGLGDETGGPPVPGIGAGDALPLMSSNAATLAVATLAWGRLRELLDASLGVAAVSFHALSGNSEAFADAVGRGRPLPGIVAAGAVLKRLCDGGRAPARLQDPFGLRCLPPVAGALHDALTALHAVLAVELNAAAENPLFAGGEVFHHGGFHAAPLALALDGLRLALVPVGTLAAARVSALMEPRLTNLSPFLAVGASGSSGLLMVEYAAADALARLRADAAPAVLGTAVVSRGLEEHASFAWQGAHQAARAADRLETLVALEWVTAERALRIAGAVTPPAVARVRELAAAFDERLDDRVFGPDVERAEAALPALARAVRAAATA